MMKKFITMIAVATMTISASAQSEAGSLTWKPNVGITYTTATGDYGKVMDGAIGLTAGVETMYMLNNQFGLALGLNYTGYNVSEDVSSKMTLIEGPDGSTTYSVDTSKKEGKIHCNYYFNIPATVNYYVASGVALKAGVALNILASSKFKDYDTQDDFNSTLISIPVGASYEFNSFVLDARYNFGLGDVPKYFVGGTYNSLTFTVGYKF